MNRLVPGTKARRNVARICETQMKASNTFPEPGIELFCLCKAGNATRETAAAQGACPLKHRHNKDGVAGVKRKPLHLLSSLPHI